MALPCPRGQLVPLELFDDGQHAKPALSTRPGCDVLPSQEEAHEILGGDGLDLPPEPLLGVGVDPSEEATRAEFLGSVGGREAAAESEALGLQPGHGDGHVTFGESGRVRELGHGRWAAVLEMTPQHLRRSGVTVERGRRGGGGMIRLEGRPREQELERRPTFDRAPQSRVRRRKHGDGSARFHQLAEPRSPLLVPREDGHGHQQVVELLGVPRFGPDLFADPLDRVRVEASKVPRGHRKASTELNRPAPALLQWGVVEVGERPAVQDLVRQYGRFHRIASDDLDPAGLDLAQQCSQAVDVHRLSQAVLERLANQRVVGDVDGPRRHVLLARRQRGEDRGHEVVGLHALDRRRVLAAAPHAQHGQRAIEVPSPPRGEHRRCQDSLPEHALDRLRGEEPRNPLEREAVLGTERQQDRVVARGGLKLEVEGDAEPLAEGQAQPPVQASTER